MVSFVNFARIASLCVGFHFGTLHGYVFHQDFWPNLNFQLEYQIKLVLITCWLNCNYTKLTNQVGDIAPLNGGCVCRLCFQPIRKGIIFLNQLLAGARL